MLDAGEGRQGAYPATLGSTGLPNPGNKRDGSKERPMTNDGQRPELDVAAIADRAAKDAGTASPAFLRAVEHVEHRAA